MRRLSNDERRTVYNSTSGYCHVCGIKLAFTNHGRTGAKGAWHVDHSVPRARGGTDRLNNLKPACVSCNCTKRDGSNRVHRARHGRSRGPMSQERRAAARTENGVIGGGVTFLAARALLGFASWPALLLSLVGLAIGRSINPDRTG